MTTFVSSVRLVLNINVESNGVLTPVIGLMVAYATKELDLGQGVMLSYFVRYSNLYSRSQANMTKFDYHYDKQDTSMYKCASYYAGFYMPTLLSLPMMPMHSTLLTITANTASAASAANAAMCRRNC